MLAVLQREPLALNGELAVPSGQPATLSGTKVVSHSPSPACTSNRQSAIVNYGRGSTVLLHALASAASPTASIARETRSLSAVARLMASCS